MTNETEDKIYDILDKYDSGKNCRGFTFDSIKWLIENLIKKAKEEVIEDLFCKVNRQCYRKSLSHKSDFLIISYFLREFVKDSEQKLKESKE